MEKYTLVNCGKEVIVGKPPVITSQKGLFNCDIDFVGEPGVRIELSNACGWKSIWCYTQTCRFHQSGKLKPGIQVQEE